MDFNELIFRIKKQSYKYILKFIRNKDIQKKIYKRKHKIVQKYISHYLNKNNIEIDKLLVSSSNSYNVFYMLWWQSNEIPNFVKINIELLKKHSNTTVILLTEKNIEKFIPEIPKVIIEKVNKKEISIQVFSDLIRAALLYKYGGIWIDSTVLTLSNVNLNIFNYELFSPVDRAGMYEFVPNGRWNIYCIGGKRGKEYFNFIYESILKFLITGTKLPDYFLIDYLMNIAYDNNIGNLKEDLNKLPFNNTYVNDLQQIFNEEFDEKNLKMMINDTFFFKGNWKHQYSSEINGKLTYYGAIEKMIGEML
ncbi:MULTISPECIES: capsular polysaccharide synthesis protein [Lactococcus]|uniref:capsular polysaccharide synthesis protein n=1 Tax=Lactococcus TaxID=1357 RepID=UPI0022DF863A|nr:MULTISPECIES: capsular polysaccharide synthesis protein [Lactococcus]MDT2895506.1 capsular polysaccharide synthesis protein [Lactococcus lactis]